MSAVFPYGSWPSQITASLLVTGSSRISEIRTDPKRSDLLWWAETRPDENGRTAVMCCELPTLYNDVVLPVSEVTPENADVRTRVHEYGGGAWWPYDGVLYYVDFADQRLRRINRLNSSEPLLLTPEYAEPTALRYADGRVTKDGKWSICVRERHEPTHDEPFNELVAVATDGSQQVKLLWNDADFVMSPRISPDGTKLAWIAWDHPHMPWDNTQLYVYYLDDLNNRGLADEILVLGTQNNRSLCQPDWVSSAADNTDRLFVCSDHENWWNLYEVNLDNGKLIPGITGKFDIADPPWVFGMQNWAASSTHLVATAKSKKQNVLKLAYLQNNQTHSQLALTKIDTNADADHIEQSSRQQSKHLKIAEAASAFEVEDTTISSLVMLQHGIKQQNRSCVPPAIADETKKNEMTSSGEAIIVAYAGASYSHETEIVALAIDKTPLPPQYEKTQHSDQTPRTRPSTQASQHEVKRKVIRQTRDLGLHAGFFVEPEAISFPTEPYPETKKTSDLDIAHALYYPATNPHCDAPANELPPLLVVAHGGPTASARRQLQLEILYWTSRGIAVVDVDYRGSTGYGRNYRQALRGGWGVADVYDCVAAASFLAERGDVDPEKLIIKGSSAGGFTVLAALAFHDLFAAGASRYGISDLALLVKDTHKFEAHYLDTLIGSWPEERYIYEQRSPILHLENFHAPVIILQGDEDRIVPPSQSEMLVEGLQKRRVPVSYVLFKGEQHGFRQAENIKTALESELKFFAEVLGFPFKNNNR
ncbi:MAG: prolyl oligopeptidase family serine peptidase [Acidimicrobiaceae bacterium]|nr:prolyl oligopeptidase family serine peptidase [Acidimicrobiaceae bacterium]